MAFITKTKSENPLDKVDDGMYDAVVKDFGQVDNKFKGRLYNEGKPEGPDNTRNNYEFQYELTVGVDTPEGEIESKIWANPTFGEKAKMRKIAKALDAWETREIEGNAVEGFDDEGLEGRKFRVLVQDGKIDSYLKAK